MAVGQLDHGVELVGGAAVDLAAVDPGEEKPRSPAELLVICRDTGQRSEDRVQVLAGAGSNHSSFHRFQFQPGESRHRRRHRASERLSLQVSVGIRLAAQPRFTAQHKQAVRACVCMRVCE